MKTVKPEKPKLNVRTLIIGAHYIVMNDDSIVVPEFLDDIDDITQLEATIAKSFMMYANTPFTILERRSTYITTSDGKKKETYPWYHVEVGITAKKVGWINSLILDGKDLKEWTY